MYKKSLWFQAVLIGFLSLFAATGAAAQSRLTDSRDRDERRTAALSQEVRHQLVTLPYYSVFDWLQAEVKPDGAVVLMGQVSQPTLKKDAESRIKELEGATGVVNNIEVLPVSISDDQLRKALYRAIYANDSPLFKYALQSVPPIHIIVRNGHVSLKGMVASSADGQLAYIAAQGVPGVFDVQNDLQTEARTE